MGRKPQNAQPMTEQPEQLPYVHVDSATFRALAEPATPMNASNSAAHSSGYRSGYTPGYNPGHPDMGVSSRRDTEVLSRRALSGPIERSPACIPFSFTRNALFRGLEPAASLPASFRTTSARPAATPAAAQPLVEAPSSSDTGTAAAGAASAAAAAAAAEAAAAAAAAAAASRIHRRVPVSQPFPEGQTPLRRKSPVAVSNPINSGFQLSAADRSVSGPIFPSASASIPKSFQTTDYTQSGPIFPTSRSVGAATGSQLPVYSDAGSSGWEQPSARSQGRRVRFADEVLPEVVRADGTSISALDTTRKQTRLNHTSARTGFSGQHMSVNIPRRWLDASQSAAAFALPPPPLAAAGVPSTPPAVVTQ